MLCFILKAQTLVLVSFFSVEFKSILYANNNTHVIQNILNGYVKSRQKKIKCDAKSNKSHTEFSNRTGKTIRNANSVARANTRYRKRFEEKIRRPYEFE